MGRKPKDLVQLTLRLRESLRRDIERSAKRQGHSLNEEIVRRIEAHSDRKQFIEEVRAIILNGGSHG